MIQRYMSQKSEIMRCLCIINGKNSFTRSTRKKMSHRGTLAILCKNKRLTHRFGDL